MSRVELNYGAYVARSITADDQRCVNLFLEPSPGGSPFPTSHYPAPGLRGLSVAPTTVCRCLYTASNGDLYGVYGSTVYYIDRTWAFTSLGTINTGTAPVSMRDNAGTNAWTPVLSGVTRSSSGYTKTASTTAWDAAVSSAESFIGGGMAAFQAVQANTDYMIGLNSDPATDAGYLGIDYAWANFSTGNCEVYESGSSVAGPFSYAAGDVFQIIYQGTTVTYLQNGVTRHTSTVVAGQQLYLDSSFYQMGAKVTNLAFAGAGAAGASGYTSTVITLYKRAATSPAVPTNDCTYTFATQAFSPVPNNGWSQSVPTADGNPLWAIAATAYANTSTDAVAHTEWSTPVTITSDGLSAATVFLFQRSATSPSVPAGTLTYTFATGALTGTLGSWSTSVPTGTNPLWIIQATASAPATLTTDSIATGEWSTPVIHAQNGADGANGGNTAIVSLYQRASSSPSVPSNDTTYTFATGGLSPSPNNGWSTTIPAVNGNPLWVTQAAAFAVGTTDAISHTEWASPVQLVTDGSTGSNGLNSAIVFLYQRATSAPSVPSSTLTYTFSTGVLSGSLGGSNSDLWGNMTNKVSNSLPVS